MNEYLRIMAVVYILGLSIIGFIFMSIDKRRAVKHKWRISERTLLLIAIIGGGIGSYLGMRCFRHKTKHTIFKVLLPLMAIIDLFFLYLLLSLKIT